METNGLGGALYITGRKEVEQRTPQNRQCQGSFRRTSPAAAMPVVLHSSEDR